LGGWGFTHSRVTQCRIDLRLSPSLATATPKIQDTLEQMEINEFNRVRKKMNEFYRI
jgi:hypothetical protein